MNGVVPDARKRVRLMLTLLAAVLAAALVPSVGSAANPNVYDIFGAVPNIAKNELFMQIHQLSGAGRPKADSAFHEVRS